MLETLVQLLFGWPAIIVSLLAAILGLVWKRPRMVGLAAVLITPFSFYLSLTPNFRGLALILPFFEAGAAYAVYKGKMLMAVLLVLPVFIVCGWVAFIVVTQ
jgi:hypothetical protein